MKFVRFCWESWGFGGGDLCRARNSFQLERKKERLVIFCYVITQHIFIQILRCGCRCCEIIWCCFCDAHIIIINDDHDWLYFDFGSQLNSHNAKPASKSCVFLSFRKTLFISRRQISQAIIVNCRHLIIKWRKKKVCIVHRMSCNPTQGNQNFYTKNY